MEIRKWLHKDVHDRLDTQKADLEVFKAEMRGRIYHAVNYAVKALSDSEVRNTRRNEMVEARQTALEKLHVEKYRIISTELMTQYDEHLEKTRKSLTEQHLVNNGAMVDLQERGIKAYSGLEKIPELNELIAKMPELLELFKLIKDAEEILEKLAKINKLFK